MIDLTTIRPRHATRHRQRPLMIMVLGAAPGHDAVASLFDLGHIPVVGLTPATAGGAGARCPDAVAADVVVPMAKRLLTRCDAVLRIGGGSSAADQIVRLARWEGKAVYHRIGDVPTAAW